MVAAVDAGGFVVASVVGVLFGFSVYLDGGVLLGESEGDG